MPRPMPTSAAITAVAISVTASTRGPSRPSARTRSHGVSTSTSLNTSRPASSDDSRCSLMMRASATAASTHAAMSARVTGLGTAEVVGSTAELVKFRPTS